jgi:hypothetical protein
MGVSKDAASVRLVYPKADSESRNSEAIVLRLVTDGDSPVTAMQSYSAEGKKAKGGRMVRTLDNKVTDTLPALTATPSVRNVADKMSVYTKCAEAVMREDRRLCWTTMQS